MCKVNGNIESLLELILYRHFD